VNGTGKYSGVLRHVLRAVFCSALTEASLIAAEHCRERLDVRVKSGYLRRMSSWRGRGAFGCWLMCGGAALVACGGSESTTSDVPAFGSDMPPAMSPPAMSPAAVPPAAVPEAPNASAGSNTDGQQAPAGDPSQPSAEGVDDSVPIDPGMMSVDPASGDGASSGTDGTDGDGTEGDGTDDGSSEPPGDGNGEPGPLRPITIWIAGDSTVANGNTPCPRGWGGVFAPHFNDLVTIRNSAVGGRSVHTWLYEVQTVFDDATGECALNRDANGEPLLQPRWQEMLDGMGAGDYLFIQFGINDGSATCDRHVGIDAFKTAYGMMAQAAKDRGAQPIFLTPVSMVRCDGNTAVGSRGGFVPATVEAGQAFDVPVIELHARSVELFQSLDFCPIAGGDVSAATTGPVGDFFCDDHTHFSSTGAVSISDVVARALVEQQIPLAAYLR
jgi:lysophospholipase L1-like esterase